MPNIGTVYGGSVTVGKDGSRTVTKTWEEVDLGSLNWNYQSSQQRFNTSDLALLAKKPSSSSTALNALCECYKVVSRNDFTDMTIAMATDGSLFCKDTNYTTKESFISAVTGQKLIYELATPLTYTLSPDDPIPSLLGVNNVFADTGNVAVDYHADPQLFIEKVTG